MTCAGITSLIIASNMVQQADATADGDQIHCCGRGDLENDRIERALTWLEKNFTVTANPSIWANQLAAKAEEATGMTTNPLGAAFWLYYLYGLERVGRLTGRRFIGGHDWYREGADCLLRRQFHATGGPGRGAKGQARTVRIFDQIPDGAWVGDGGPTIGTSFALLFLSKGRRPVLLAKLRHGPGQDWNQHRGDVANLTAYVENAVAAQMAWQVIDLDQASADDLLEAPVIYLCGNQSPLPADRKEQRRLAVKLHDYLDRGGFLFAEGYCGGDGFDRGFRTLMALVFAYEPEYRLKLLDRSHPIWHIEEKVPPEQQRPLLGIEFGCRTSVVYAPPDPPKDPRPSLSCLWELSRSGRQRHFTPAVQAQIDAARSIGINILAYATDREVQPTEEDFAAAPQPRHRMERGKIFIAKLRHPGDCDAAPDALVHLMETAMVALKIRLDLHPALLDITDPALFDYHLVFMQGRTAFRLTGRERAQLKRYVERGGMVLADAIGDSKAFAESFRREMAAVFPDHPLKVIPAGDAMLTTTYGGFDLAKVSRRDPQPGGAGGPVNVAVRRVPLELEGIKLGNRYGVIFSPFDLSCALEKHESLEGRGYKREDAARIGLNVLLYSLQQ